MSRRASSPSPKPLRPRTGWLSWMLRSLISTPLLGARCADSPVLAVWWEKDVAGVRIMPTAEAAHPQLGELLGSLLKPLCDVHGVVVD